MQRAFVIFIASCILAVALAQVAPPPAATPGTPQGTISTTSGPNTCQLVQTSQLIGYIPGSNIRVYRNTCSGSCLSASGAPTQCLTTTQRIRLATRPWSTNTVRVTQIESCECLAERCTVTINGVTSTFEHGATVIDGCERSCTCSFGQLVNCCRQRKEFRLGLSNTEKQRYLNALRIISTTAPYRSQYDALIRKHTTYFGSGIHGGPLFFPWHREYIWDLENILKQVDCRITVPYWRWSLEATAPFSSSIWSSTNGFGGNGNGGCISSGPFSPPWVTTDGSCLRRNWAFGSTYATEADISQTLDSFCPGANQFSCMANRIESFHNYVHGSISGQMGGSLSANDPIFFMHHTYIDYIWARWQSKSAAHVTAYSGNPSQVHPGSPGSIVSEWMDLNRQNNDPENRVCYMEPPNAWWVQTVLSPGTNGNLQSVGATQGSEKKSAFTVTGNYHPVSEGCTTHDRLRQIPRIPLGPFPTEFLNAMNMDKDSMAELRRLHDERNNNYTIVSVNEVLSTRGPFADLGFYLYDEDFKCLNSGDNQLSASSYVERADDDS